MGGQDESNRTNFKSFPVQESRNPMSLINKSQRIKTINETIFQSRSRRFREMLFRYKLLNQNRTVIEWNIFILKLRWSGWMALKFFFLSFVLVLEVDTELN